MSRIPASPLLLYDGHCGFCHASVLFVLERDRGGALQFAARDGETGRRIIAARPGLDEVDSLIWVDDPADPGSRALAYSDAVLEVVRYLGGGWRFLGVFRAVPRPIRDGVYRFVAAHRRRIAASRAECPLPPDGEAHRFLD